MNELKRSQNGETMEKTRLEDLDVINYRFGGLVEKICKTH
jgi:hypothetical protein